MKLIPSPLPLFFKIKRIETGEGFHNKSLIDLLYEIDKDLRNRKLMFFFYLMKNIQYMHLWWFLLMFMHLYAFLEKITKICKWVCIYAIGCYHCLPHMITQLNFIITTPNHMNGQLGSLNNVLIIFHPYTDILVFNHNIKFYFNIFLVSFLHLFQHKLKDENMSYIFFCVAHYSRLRF